eukprot:jgi/Tetstr1/466892/TSEL_011347.t1
MPRRATSTQPRAADVAPERGRTIAGHARGPVGSGSRADSCTPESDYMRHRMRRSWQAWADLGVGRQVVDMIRNGVCIPFKNGPPAPFNQGVSMEDATPDQLRFMDDELARFLASGAWEEGHCSQWVSRLFLVPKPGVNTSRLIIDIRPLNRYCEERSLSFETLTRLRHLARSGEYMLSMNLRDGFYAVGIAPEDNCRGAER